MLFGPNVRYFNELEINGKNVDEDEDYTKDEPETDPVENEDEESTDNTSDEGVDDLADFTEDEFDSGVEEPTDVTPAEDTGNESEPVEDADDNLIDYTEDEFDSGEDTDGEEPTGDNEETSEGNTPTEGSDDLADFTEDEFDSADDTSTEGSEESTGDDGGKDSNTEEENADGDESTTDSNTNTLADMEKNLFADLSPQQLAIKNNELLQNYIELYETISTVFDSINKIPKTFNNTRSLTFIADQLVALKDMVNYVITTTYVTRTYVENMAYYKQALLVLEQLNSMLKALIQKPAK